MAMLQVSDDGLSQEQFNASLSLILVFRLLVSIPVIARLVCSKDKRFRLWLDDYLITAASITFWIQAIAEIVRAATGKYGHERTFETSYKASLANDVLYPVVMTLTRWSITTQVLYYFALPRTSLTGDVTRKKRPTAKLTSFVALAFNGVWGIFAILIAVLQCIPYSSMWYAQEREMDCISLSAVVLSISTWGFACSIVTAGAAIAPVLGAGAWKSKRFGSLLTLGLGLCTLAVEAARIGTGVTVSTRLFIQSSAIYNMLTPIECSLAILTACTPFIIPSNSSSQPKRSFKDHLIALRDRVFVGKDTFNYRYAPYYEGPLDEGTALMRPSQSYHPGRAQVQSTPVILPKSPLDPLPRFADMRRGESCTSQHIQIQQEVHVEMEDIPRIESQSSPRKSSLPRKESISRKESDSGSENLRM